MRVRVRVRVRGVQVEVGEGVGVSWGELGRKCMCLGMQVWSTGHSVR